jgi:type III secretion protein Q
LTRSETQALAALATQGSGVAVDLPQGQQAVLQLTPLAPGLVPPAAATAQRLQLEWGGGQIALDIATPALDGWVQMVLGVPNLVQLPDAFRQSALEHVLRWITSALNGAARGPAHLQSMAAAPAGRPADAPHALALELRLQEGPALACTVHMDSLALMLVSSLAQALPATGQDQDMDGLPVALQLCVGQTHLPLGQLRTLKPGAMVFFEQSYLHTGQSMLLRTALGARRFWSAQASMDNGQLILTSKPTTMTTPTDPIQESDDAPISFEDMPIHLSFDLGQKVLTLGQLRQLREGHAIALDRDLQAAVSIRTNGALIGQGQLLDIDGRIGVLINRLDAPQANPTE